MSNLDKAATIVDKIIEDFTDRSGLQNEWEQIDDDVRDEIRTTWIKLTLAELEGGSK